MSSFPLGFVGCSGAVEELGDGRTSDQGSEEEVCGAPGAVVRYHDVPEGCVFLEGVVVVFAGYGVTNLARLQGLQRVSQGVTIHHCLELTSLDGLNQLEQVGENGFGAFRSPQLRDLSALAMLHRVEGAFVLQDLEGLADLAGVEGLSYVGGSLVLERLPAVRNLSEFAGVEHVAGGLRISGNHHLEALWEVSGPLRIEGDLVFRDNPRLSRARIEAFAASVEYAGALIIEGNGP